MECGFLARFCNLFSGSSGNCTYIGGGNGGILIDAGVSCKRIEKALSERNIEPKSIAAIFITHEHTDHINGVRVFASKYKTNVYATPGTLEELDNMGIINGKFPTNIIDDSGIEAAGMKVIPFDTPHDSRQSCGYRIDTPDGRKIAVATDIGYISDTVRKAITGCDFVLIESNHDVHMLESGAYPYYLKRRILSDRGHLSNESCAAELASLAKSGTTRFLLGHISMENNLPQIAYHTSLNALQQAGFICGCDFLLDYAERISTRPVEVF